MTKTNYSILNILLLLTGIFIFSEFLFLGISFYTNGIDGIVYAAMLSKLTFSRLEFLSFSHFIFSQALIYAIFIYILWFLTISIKELFSFSDKNARLVAILLWLISIISILAANTTFSSHSFFSKLIQKEFFSDSISLNQFKQIFTVSGLIFLFFVFLALINIGIDFYKKKNRLRNNLFFIFVLLLLFISNLDFLFKKKNHIVQNTKPNVFIIGLDAVRPDYLTFFNKQRKSTPQLDDFLKTSVVFMENYTPLAKTLPSWISILTSNYPLHTGARDDMINADSLHLNETLPDLFKKAGYETIYASDDNRFSNIRSYHLGFDNIIGPSGNAMDFILSAINDFPMSNLIIPMGLGKQLFSFSHANHAATQTYAENNFLDMIDQNLQKRSDKPLFFAAHFNVTGWPFYWFNDHLANNESNRYLYSHAIKEGDTQFGKLIHILKEKGLLENAIFILLSDHGMTFNNPGDKIVSESLFQGDAKQIKLIRNRYSNFQLRFGNSPPKNEGENRIIYVNNNNLNSYELVQKIQNAISPFNLELYGIDSAWGYGTDVLSLKQYHTLLAIKTYGNTLSNPHKVTGRSLLLDITPTVLDLLQLPPLTKSEGISLKPYLAHADHITVQRPIFFESSFSFSHMDKAEIAVNQLVASNIEYFEIHPKNEYIFINPSAEKLFIKIKQRAILVGNWLLAYYPPSQRTRIIKDENGLKMQNYVEPPYSVIVNLETGKWTSQLNTSFALTSPLKSLSEQLDKFFGTEMMVYHSGTHQH